MRETMQVYLRKGGTHVSGDCEKVSCHLLSSMSFFLFNKTKQTATTLVKIMEISGLSILKKSLAVSSSNTGR